MVEFGEELDDGELIEGEVGIFDDAGNGEEVALEEFEAGLFAGIEFLSGFDFFGEEHGVSGVFEEFQFLEERGRGEGADIELDDVGEFDEGAVIFGELKIIEGDPVAFVDESSDGVDDVGVGGDVFEDFEDDARFIEHADAIVEDPFAGAIDEGGSISDESVEADFEEGIGEEPGGGEGGIVAWVG